MARIVGIDLGTTNSVVAVLEGGRPQVIASAEGGRTTPSVVGFSKDQELLVGQLARRQLVLNPRNTFANLKRFVGRQWDELDDGSLAVPYTVRANDQGNVRVVCPATEREYAPEELVASVLRKLVDDASTFLGEPVEAAVITVPAYFNDAQRQATRDAGRLAGISVERILNEPTAAALAYGFDRSTVKRVLVFDLGGGTFDVSILRVAQGVFDVKATSGDTQLGGNDWDRRIVDWLADAFQKEHEIDLRRDRQALQRLTEAAEKAKIELSGVQSTPISLPFIATGKDGPLHIETSLERSTFEGLCPDLLDRLLRPVQRALRDSGFAAEDIDDVVLVGGSTRMPMVQQMVRTLVPLEPCQSVNPDEVVSIGAAVQLNGGTNRDDLVGVDRLTGLQGHKGAHHLLHHRHSGGATHEDHIVDVLRRETGIAERALHRAKQTIEQIRAESFKGAALEAGLDMQGAVLAGRDEGQGNRGALHTTEFDLGLLGRLGQPLEGLAIAAQINLVLLLEGIRQPVDDPTVPVVSAELGVSTGGLDVEDPLGNAQDRDVKGAATQVKDQHAFDRAAIKSVGKGRRGGLVQDPLNRNPSQTAGITGGLTLGIVEIGGDRDHRGLDGLTEEGAGVVHQLAEHAGHQFFRRVFPLSGGADHTDIALIVGANGVGDGQAAVVQLIPLTANKTLEIGEGVARVQHELAPGQLTNKQFLVFAEADH